MDDNLRGMKYYIEYLELDGFIVKSFDVDEDAIDYVEKNRNRIVLVILDVIIPSRRFKKEDTDSYYTTGVALLKLIRGVLPKVPMILFTIRQDLELDSAMKNLGVKHIMIKDQTSPALLSEKILEIVGTPASG
jgi:DNA-binding NarL/FixJ family response regulator